MNALYLTMAIKNLDNNQIAQLDILFKAFVQHLAKKNNPKLVSWQNLQNYLILHARWIGFFTIRLQF